MVEGNFFRDFQFLLIPNIIEAMDRPHPHTLLTFKASREWLVQGSAPTHRPPPPHHHHHTRAAPSQKKNKKQKGGIKWSNFGWNTKCEYFCSLSWGGGNLWYVWIRSVKMWCDRKSRYEKEIWASVFKLSRYYIMLVWKYKTNFYNKMKLLEK